MTAQKMLELALDAIAAYNDFMDKAEEEHRQWHDWAAAYWEDEANKAWRDYKHYLTAYRNSRKDYHRPYRPLP